MGLEKQTLVDKIEIIENGFVQVRTATKIIEDGKVLSETFHRSVVCPGDDYSAQDPRVRAVCAAVHTPEVIAAYQQSRQESKPEFPLEVNNG